MLGKPSASGSQFGNHWKDDFDVHASGVNTTDECEVFRSNLSYLFHSFDAGPGGGLNNNSDLAGVLVIVDCVVTYV